MSQAVEQFYDPEQLPPKPVLAGFLLWCLSTAFVILALSAYTYSLDDIKIPGLYIGGALCLAAWLALWTFDFISAPPKLFWGGFVAYLLVCVISTLLAQKEAVWVGWQYTAQCICAFGYTLLGASVIRTKRMAELALKFWVVLALITTVFGLLHYSGFLGKIYAVLYPVRTGEEGRLHDLLYTFKESRSMLSTILNVQFFGNFLLMVLPVIGSCAILVFSNLKRRGAQQQSVVRPITWTILSGVALVFSLTCIFTTYSKSSVCLLPLVIIAFVVAIFLFTTLWKAPPKKVLGAGAFVVLLVTIMGATVFYFTYGDFREQMKDLHENIAPRRIMFGAAYKIFEAHPVLGGGPGSYRILFPQYRSPDYHMARISNVTTYSHNWLLDLMAETGVLGTAAYLLFLFALMLHAWKAIRTCPDMILRTCVIGCVIGVLSLLGGSMTTPMSRWPVGVVALHSMIGMAMGIVSLALAKQVKRSRGFEYVEPLPLLWDRGRTIRGTLLAASLAYVIHATVSARATFLASYEHNEGVKLVELPEHYFGKSGLAEDPRVIAMINEGVAHFKKSLEYDPARPTTYYKMAHAYNRLGQEAPSLECYLALQKYFPDYAEIHYNLGVIYYNMALDAKSRMEAAQARHEDAEAEAQRAEMLNNYDLAAKQFDRQATLSNKISVWYFRANVHYLKAEKLDPNAAETRQLYQKAGEYFARAAKLPIATVIQEDTQVDREQELKLTALKKARESFRRAGNGVAAAEAAREYLKQFPSSLAALSESVQFLQALGKIDNAIQMLDDALTRNPLNREVLMMKLKVLADAGRVEDAKREANYVLALDKIMSGNGQQATLLEANQRTQARQIAATGSIQ
ncbi:O-antigen ligase family protein [Candidatus Sumerlaeota bacterium]|nr:O-antigen ligase family protein [Candidatus Sumerlaeota bacterium]